MALVTIRRSSPGAVVFVALDSGVFWFLCSSFCNSVPVGCLSARDFHRRQCPRAHFVVVQCGVHVCACVCIKYVIRVLHIIFVSHLSFERVWFRMKTGLLSQKS